MCARYQHVFKPKSVCWAWFLEVKNKGMLQDESKGTVSGSTVPAPSQLSFHYPPPIAFRIPFSLLLTAYYVPGSGRSIKDKEQSKMQFLPFKG